MNSPRRRMRGVLREFRLHALWLLASLALFELALQVLDIRYLGLDTNNMASLQYRYDAELGWSPRPNSQSTMHLPRPTSVSHNSLGIRDVEFRKNERPTILFIGDSMTWGYNVQAPERFSDRLRGRIQSHNVVNAGVSGFGTDQQYLFLKRLWNDIEPSLVVLVFCVENDHADNSRNLRYSNFKPYLAEAANGEWQFRGQPVPRPRISYFEDNWFAQRVMLVRLAISVYVELAHLRVRGPDPTERLLTMMHELVEQKGAKLLVGVERHDPPVENVLKTRGIPYVMLDGAELDGHTHHWSARGNALVAERLATLLSANGIQVSASDAGETPASNAARP